MNRHCVKIIHLIQKEKTRVLYIRYIHIGRFDIHCFNIARRSSETHCLFLIKISHYESL